MREAEQTAINNLNGFIENERKARVLGAELAKAERVCGAFNSKIIKGEMRNDELGVVYDTLISGVRKFREGLIEIMEKGSK